MADLIIDGGSRLEPSPEPPRIPGDKSISHRVLLAAAASPGSTRIEGLNRSPVVEVLSGALRALGVSIREEGGDVIVGSFAERALSKEVPRLSLGPSSAAARLLFGLLVGLGVRAEIDGDASLRARPMAWVIDPLRALGASISELGEPGRLPVATHGARLSAGAVRLTVGSAQARSAVIFAAIGAGVRVEIDYPVLSRDHTERLLRHLGVSIHDDGSRLIVEGRALPPLPFHRVPGDPSAASCLAAAQVLRGRSLSLSGVCLNPTRTGFFDLLAEIGVPVTTRDRRDEAGEPVGSLAIDAIGSAAIHPFTVARAERFHALIDEVPLAAAVATRAAGRSSFFDAGELTFKETDRLASTRAMLAAFGAEVEVEGHALHVRGGRPLHAGVVPSAGDHRIAMAAVALASSLPGVTRVEGGSCVESSFPGFCAALRAVGCDVREVP